MEAAFLRLDRQGYSVLCHGARLREGRRRQGEVALDCYYTAPTEYKQPEFCIYAYPNLFAEHQPKTKWKSGLQSKQAHSEHGHCPLRKKLKKKEKKRKEKKTESVSSREFFATRKRCKPTRAICQQSLAVGIESVLLLLVIVDIQTKDEDIPRAQVLHHASIQNELLRGPLQHLQETVACISQ